MSDLRISEWDSSRAEAIRDLLRVCFDDNPKARPGVMEWQYWSNPFGTSATVVALDGDVLVGHHTAYQIPLRLGAESVMGAIQVDTATLPEYRGRGLYGTLSRALYEACEARGVSLMLGNPNLAAFGPLQRVGWIAVDEPRLYVRVVDPKWLGDVSGFPGRLASPIARIAFPRRLTGGATECETVPEGLSELTASIWEPRAAGVWTDETWWDWRYQRHPERPYRSFAFREGRLLGAAAAVRAGVERGQEVVQVVDLLARSPRSARAVVDAAIASSPGVGGLTALATPGGVHARALSWAGFRRVPRRLRGQRTRFGILQLAPLATDPFALEWTMSAGMLDYT